MLRLAVLPGDGIGPEVTAAACTVLDAVAERAGLTLTRQEAPVGWAAIRERGVPLPEETISLCLEADAVLLGAVGHPDADAVGGARPEDGLLELRARLGCWANLRPVRVPTALVDRSALRPERVRGTDLLIVRELGGGLYYGTPRSLSSEQAVNTLCYTAGEVERIARLACELAARRRGHVTSVDKANVLEVSRLWRAVVERVAVRAPGVTVEHMLVDRAAMELVLRPDRFDVVLTANLFGDILSDEAAALPGSLGVLGSASLGGVTDLYEPVHGSAPEIAGTGSANPAGAIHSVALLLRHTARRPDLAEDVERAVARVWADGAITPDLAGPGENVVGTEAFTRSVVECLG